MSMPDVRGIGDNRPPEVIYQDVVDRLGRDYAQVATSATNLVDSASAMPESVRDEAMLQSFANLIVAIRDAIARVEAARTAEKEPYLRSGQAVDGFFGTIKEVLTKARNSLHQRVDAYQNRKLAIERERIRLEAEQRAREARELREREERARREAEEARLAATRARLPENREQKAATADELARQASRASADAVVAADAAEKARIETLRKSSEIARSRFEDGRLVTMKQEGYVEVVDIDALPGDPLWRYVRPEHKRQALRDWAKATGYSQQMAGAVIELRDTSVER